MILSCLGWGLAGIDTNWLACKLYLLRWLALVSGKVVNCWYSTLSLYFHLSFIKVDNDHPLHVILSVRIGRCCYELIGLQAVPSEVIGSRLRRYCEFFDILPWYLHLADLIRVCDINSLTRTALTPMYHFLAPDSLHDKLSARFQSLLSMSSWSRQHLSPWPKLVPRYLASRSLWRWLLRCALPATWF